MPRNRWIFAIVNAGLLASASAAYAQEAPPPPEPEGGQVAVQVRDDGPGAPFAQRIELLGFEGLGGGKTVTGAPFTGTAVSETVQMLADGNKISHTTQSTIYRDSQGRFRKEVTLTAIGPLAASGKARTFVVIQDPVAGTGYILHPEEKVARKIPGPRGSGAAGGAAGGDVFYGVGQRGAMVYHKFAGGPAADAKTEDLGTQTIDGVSAQGTRTTRTIAAGEIGNEKPITLVTEKWYSPDLQMVVKSTRNDPRFGTTTYTLTNIQRTEPAASLFTVPQDYTVREGRPDKGMRDRMGVGPAGPPPPPDAPVPPSN